MENSSCAVEEQATDVRETGLAALRHRPMVGDLQKGAMGGKGNSEASNLHGSISTFSCQKKGEIA